MYVAKKKGCHKPVNRNSCCLFVCLFVVEHQVADEWARNNLVQYIYGSSMVSLFGS